MSWQATELSSKVRQHLDPRILEMPLVNSIVNILMILSPPLRKTNSSHLFDISPVRKSNYVTFLNTSVMICT